MANDLVIIKVPIPIPATKTVIYDQVFMALGAFHIELLLFGALRKYITHQKLKLSERGCRNSFIGEAIIVAVKSIFNSWLKYLEFYYLDHF